MGRGKGKGKKFTVVTSNDDPGSGDEDVLPPFKRRGRPHKPLKDDIYEDDYDEKFEEGEDDTKLTPPSKELKDSTVMTGKKRKRFSKTKENPDLVMEESGVGSKPKTEDLVRSNGFRHNGSRRKSKPRRAAEAGVEYTISLKHIAVLTRGSHEWRISDLFPWREDAEESGTLHSSPARAGPRLKLPISKSKSKLNLILPALENTCQLLVPQSDVVYAPNGSIRQWAATERLKNPSFSPTGPALPLFKEANCPVLGLLSGLSECPWMGCRGSCTVSTMESSSLKPPGASGTSGDTPHGLKFGQRVYFDDGGESGSSSKSQLAPLKEAPAPAGKKGKGPSQGGQQRPRCQVEGCNVDLTGAKAYYCRHKVCGMHSKAPKVVVAGLEQRFCQQCSRFHQLPEFDQGKRSCRRRLAGHNERRRKPPPGPFASRYGRFAASFHEEPSRHRSFVMDFSYPNLSSGTTRDLWPNARASHRAPAGEWRGPFDTAAMHAASHPCFQDPRAGGPFCAPMELPPGECLAGVSDSSCALSLLSTDPWSGSSAGGHAPSVAAASAAFDGPLAVAHSVVPGKYIGTTSSWGLIRGPGGSRTSSHDEMQHDLGLAGATTTESRVAPFSGQVDFTLPENGQCLEEHGSARAYDHLPGPDMHWSL